MKLLHPTFAFCLIFITQNVAIAQNWEGMLNKIDEAYYEGNYAKAIKATEKFGKKVEKKIGNQSHFYIIYKTKKARNFLANKQLWLFLNDISEAENLNREVNENSAYNYISDALDICELYIDYGNFKKSAEYLEQIEKKIPQLPETIPDFVTKIGVYKAKTLLGQGFYAKSLEFINANIDYYKKRAITKETYEDPKSGKLKSRVLPEDVILKGFTDYAIMQQLECKAMWKQGDFLGADSEFVKTLNWIDNQKVLGKSNLVYLETSFMFWQMSKEQGLNDKDLRKDLEKLHSKSRSSLYKNHYLNMDLYYNLLKLYLDTNDERYDFKLTQYQVLVIGEYPASSTYRVNMEMLKIYKEKENYTNEEMQDRIVSVSRNIPVHQMKTELFDFGYTQSIFRKYYNGIGFYAKSIVDVDKELYGSNAPNYHLSLINYANYLLDYGNDFDKIDSIYSFSFHQVVKPEIKIGHKDYIIILNHLAKYYESTDQFEKATEALDEAATTVRTLFDNEDYEFGKELNSIAELQIKIGAFKNAEENITKANQILEPLKNDEIRGVYYAQTLQNKAKLLSIYGEFDEAEILLHRSEKIVRKAYNLQGYDDLNAKIDIAEVRIRLGQYNKTKELLEETLATYKSIYGNDSRHLIRPLISLGNFQLATGDFSDSEKNARRALDIALTSIGPESSKTGLCLNLLTDYYLTIGDYDKALEPSLTVNKIYKNKYGKNHINYAAVLSKLALIKFYQGESFEQIDPLYANALEIAGTQLGRKSPAYAEILSKYALLEIREENFGQAFGKINEAYSIWKSRLGVRNNINKATIYVLAGDVYYHMKQYDKATEFYKTAGKVFEDLFNESHPKYIDLQYKLGKVYYMKADYRKSRKTMDFVIEEYNMFIEQFFPSLSEREKTKFWNTIKPAYEFYNTLALIYKDQSPRVKTSMLNNALNTKALLLSSTLKVKERILSSNDVVLINKFKLWQEKKEQLTTTLSMSKDQLANSEISVSALTQEVELLEKEIGEKSALFNSSFENKNVTWKDIKEKMGQNEVAIEMVRFRYFDQVFTDSIIYAVFYYKNRRSFTEPGLLLLANGKDLENKYYKSYRNSIIFKVKDRFSYDNYWKPIIGKIGTTSTIYLSGDGVYNQINLEAIPVDGTKYVLDNSNIILVSNTKDIYYYKIKEKIATSTNKATIIGNPNYYVTSTRPNRGYVGQLPGTEKEVNDLNAVLETNGWATTTFMADDATESIIKSTISPRVFHIATHGFFKSTKKDTGNDLLRSSADASQNPLLRTGLMLSGAGDILNKTSFNFNIEDGILTAYEAMNLSFDGTDLVVLSACETGLGDVTAGEGVYGLQRAFIVAGASTLIMSMFKVNDEATQKLMVTFYQKWLDTGNKRQSFIDAKKEIRNEFKDPIYWGAFIMIGVD